MSRYFRASALPVRWFRRQSPARLSPRRFGRCLAILPITHHSRVGSRSSRNRGDCLRLVVNRPSVRHVWWETVEERRRGI